MRNFIEEGKKVFITLILFGILGFFISKMFESPHDWSEIIIYVCILVFSLEMSIIAGLFIPRNIGTETDIGTAQMYLIGQEKVWATQLGDNEFLWWNGKKFDNVDKIRYESGIDKGYVVQTTCHADETMNLIAICLSKTGNTILVIPEGGPVLDLRQPNLKEK